VDAGSSGSGRKSNPDLSGEAVARRWLPSSFRTVWSPQSGWNTVRHFLLERNGGGRWRDERWGPVAEGAGATPRRAPPGAAVQRLRTQGVGFMMRKPTTSRGLMVFSQRSRAIAGGCWSPHVGILAIASVEDPDEVGTTQKNEAERWPAVLLTRSGSLIRTQARPARMDSALGARRVIPRMRENEGTRVRRTRGEADKRACRALAGEDGRWRGHHSQGSGWSGCRSGSEASARQSSVSPATAPRTMLA